MQFINLIQQSPYRKMMTIFTESGYKGESCDVFRGSFEIDQLTSKPIKSIKLEENCSLTIFENSSKTGRSEILTKDVEDVTSLNFVPKSIFVTIHAKCYKDGKEINVLAENDLKASDLKVYDKICVPKGMSLILCENPNDENAVHIYSDDEFLVSSKIDSYNRAIFATLGFGDFVLNFKADRELSDDELMAVAGGACKVDACAAKACAADGPCAANIG